ncbi:hypothetical protein [Streptomyces sp. WELS2]|uniref:hypothetical protein n=1 Tax=Streptomyces sp. WELS2 TaxID=2749435 RepID=UPI0015F09078|nr:hypothetical protein [Streptomyces sp. WELS2]
MADLLAGAARAVGVVSAMATLFGSEASHGFEEPGATVGWPAHITEEAAGRASSISCKRDTVARSNGFPFWTT